MTIEPYTPDLRASWDEAVEAARNSNFQHYRAYMDYHADRFADCSVLARDDKSRIVAVLPAHAVGTTVCSHRGLTFGGWLMGRRADMPAMMEIWRLASHYYAEAGFTSLYYRPAPHIYHSYPAEEDIYAAFRAGATLRAVQASSVIDLTCPLGFDMSYRQGMRKAAAAGVEIRPTDDYATFWPLLTDVLRTHHDTSPVHTLAEIELLHSRFPAEIQLYGAYLDGKMIAGVVMYYTDTVAHSQYTAASDIARKMRVLPLLYSMIMEESAARGLRWFDFGTSCEDEGRYLNEGLIRQKCAFGSRTVVYQAFDIPLS